MTHQYGCVLCVVWCQLVHFPFFHFFSFPPLCCLLMTLQSTVYSSSSFSDPDCCCVCLRKLKETKWRQKVESFILKTVRLRAGLSNSQYKSAYQHWRYLLSLSDTTVLCSFSGSEGRLTIALSRLLKCIITQMKISSAFSMVLCLETTVPLTTCTGTSAIAFGFSRLCFAAWIQI